MDWGLVKKDQEHEYSVSSQVSFRMRYVELLASTWKTEVNH